MSTRYTQEITLILLALQHINLLNAAFSATGIFFILLGIEKKILFALRYL